MIDNVFVIPVLRSDYIEKCIETLYQYTHHDFRVVVVDQTKAGLPDIEGVHLRVRPNRNLGFSKACNEGIIHGLHWKSKYITCWNDDVECINDKWWEGIMGTFAMESHHEILAVNPESARIPLWGYGRPPNEYVEVISYAEAQTEAGYARLLRGDFSHLKGVPDSFPRSYTGVCDAFAAFAPVFKRKHFDLIGLWDERFYPGGAEDYDMMTRIYSKGYRAVSSRASWVWHWWGKSKDEQTKAQQTGMAIDPSRSWADLSFLWPPEANEGHNLDVWGKYKGKDGQFKYFKRRPEIGVVDM